MKWDVVTANVSGSQCEIIPGDLLVEDTVGIYPIQVNLDEEWEGLAVTAVFRAGAVSVDVVLTSDGVIEVPPDVLTEGRELVFLGFHGANAEGTIVRRTVPVRLGEVIGSLPPSGFDPSGPTPDWAAQVQLMAMNAYDMAREAISKVQEIDSHILVFQDDGDGNISVTEAN